MALIDELKEQLKDAETLREELRARRKALQADERSVEVHADHLRTAIAALKVADDHAYFAEQETAREQLEREPEIPEEGLGSSLIAMGYGDDEPLDAPGETVEYEDPTAVAIAAYIEAENAEPEAPALNPDMQDEREQPVALTQPEWNEPDGYAPVTNPEADALARAHDWYDPKAVADRERFNPFAMFRRQTEDV